MNIEQVNIADKKCNLITLKNQNVELTILDLGALVFSLKTKDRNGKFENIVLQYDDIQEYAKNPSYFGATIGRVPGRIKNAQMKLNNEIYHLDKNFLDKHTLHGGYSGLHSKHFDFEIISESKIKLKTTQKSEDDKFPGNVCVSVTYEILENAVMISYEAISDADTVLSITNHCHYNLSVEYKTTIENHDLQIDASNFVNIDQDMLPVEIIDLPEEMNFQQKTTISEKLKYSESKYFNKGGIDHCYIVDGAAILENNESGRRLKVSSSYPAMQIYTCNFSRGHTLSNGRVLKKYDAICFEPQFIPPLDGCYDSNPAYLKKGEKYQQFIKLEF